MARRSKHSSAVRIVTRAVAAYKRGSCLGAGQLIDKAYMALGKRSDRQARAMLKELDEKFEKTCVKKHPSRSRR